MQPGFHRARRRFLLSLAALGASPVLAPSRVLGASQPEGGAGRAASRTPTAR
ncbi:hypothetical protein ISE1_4189 [plant metagenome]|uniref:Uncharacterized protein n=1 Tax=plant metagenome TaxID=1297885 RepID=A0A484U6C0_9ZZZZ